MRGGTEAKIVGIDASLTSTGVAVIKGDTSSTIAIQSNQTGVKRLIEIRDHVRDIVGDADFVVIEGYAYARVNQAHKMGELGGVLRVMFREEGIKYIEVAPSAVKKFATGKGNANKEAVAVGIYKRWGKELWTNDEADAFVLAKIGQAYLSGGEGLTCFQKDVIKKIKLRI
jgi:crossover junction endodeoxyribonuclease RuvC